MNKSELIQAVARRERIPLATVEQVVTAFLEVTSLSLSCGEDVLLTNFGKFEIRPRKPSVRRNPKTGDRIEVPAKNALGFKPSGRLRAKLNP